jgi:hypothetical protein
MLPVTIAPAVARSQTAGSLRADAGAMNVVELRVSSGAVLRIETGGLSSELEWAESKGGSGGRQVVPLFPCVDRAPL